MGSVEECAARSVHGWSLVQVQQMAERWEETPLQLPRLVGCEQLDPHLPPPAPPPTAASLPASSQQEACGVSGSQAGSQARSCGAAPAQAAGGGGGGGRGGGRGGSGGSVWDAEEEEEDAAEEEEDGEARGGGTSRAAAPPLSRRGEVEGTVKGDVSALGGLMGSYAKKRVRWADEEQAKDEDFMRTKAGFTLQACMRMVHGACSAVCVHSMCVVMRRTNTCLTAMQGTAPLKRQRIRSPPPEDRAEADDD